MVQPSKNCVCLYETTGKISSLRLGIKPMLQHNLLITFRGFLKNKGSFQINLLGLSTGIASALFIFLWVMDEISINKFHKNDAQLFQVMQKMGMSEGIAVRDWVPGLLAEAMREELASVKSTTVYKSHPVLSGIVTVGKNHLSALPMYADQSYLEVFTFPLLHGDKNQALSDKYATVISEELAIKLFSTSEDAVGKTIQWEKSSGALYGVSQLLTVTGVFKSIPRSSTENFDLILNFDFYLEHNPGAALWTNDQATAAVVLEPGTDLAAFEQSINQLVSRKVDYEKQFVLQRYSSRYLYSKYENGVQSGGRITYVWLFSGVAILILLIASINFMNLATAKASIRVKEIGVKKTLGASRKSLIIQFVNESLLMSILALFIALVLVFLLLPYFNEITGKQIQRELNLNWFASFLGIAIGTGLLSSTYPALYLSGFRPIEVLKGKLNISWGELWTRNGLVVFQFAISFLLIVAILVIYQQMTYVNTKNLGFDKDHILTMKQEGMSNNRIESFLAEVRQLPAVIQAANSNHRLVGAENWTWGITWEGQEVPYSFAINPIITNYFFIETFGINIKEGRSFSPEYGTDSLKVILNETAVKRMGLENPIGQIITFWGDDVEIIGVAEDFHFQSLYQTVGPCIIKKFGTRDNYASHIWIKLKAGQEKAAIAAIGQLYDEFNPGYVFDYGFVDEDYQALYQSENKASALLGNFAVLAIIISCLGLLGLTAFTTERRTKEIGIRKILGASIWNVTYLLSKGFTKMVMLAILIALPASYIIATSWLDSFAYRVNLQWWLFAGVAVITMSIAWLTVGLQTLKTANINPVESLQVE